jgi:hypothetical protein
MASLIVPLAFTVLLGARPDIRVQTIAGPIWLGEGDETSAISPDGKWRLVVPKSKPGVFPWLTLQAADNPDDQEQRWPLQRAGCYVLWRPDGKAFAVTDPMWANYYFVRLFRTDFQLEGPRLGSPVVDLSGPIEAAFKRVATKYYAPKKYELLMFYPKVLRWITNTHLLVGLDARTAEESPREGAEAAHEWYLGYLIDTEKRQVIRELDERAVRSEFGIDLEKQTW